ncbi:MAG: hypothetical protein ACKOXK_05445 [Chakrabartia sp.]
MKKSIILSAVALAALGLAGCGQKAADQASNAEIELNDTMAPVANESLEAAPVANATKAEETTNDVAADAADAAKDAAAAAAAAAANHM